MRHLPLAASTGLLAAGLLLAGCTSSTPPRTPGTAVPGTSAESATAAASPKASPSASSTLTAEQQQAVKDATNTVVAYRQIGLDLYSGARTRINDLDDVTTGDFHDEEIRGVSQKLAQGWTTTPKGVQLELVSAEPVKVNLTKDPPTVVIRACIDATRATAIDPDGNRTPGIREELTYYLEKADYLPAPGWAVTRVTGAAKESDRSC